MKKPLSFALILALILTSIMVFILALTPNSSEKNLVFTHSHTKAICNSENLCQDYEIFCKKQEVVKISPITGAVVQFPTNWKDPRNEETKNRIC